MRAVILVIDSFGIGALPDAREYGDEGSNTALHIAEGVGGANWPRLRKLGLGNAAKLLGHDLPGCEAVENPMGAFGVMAEKSPGKDTTTGHWELAGLLLEKAFHVFPGEYPSFPPELEKAFSQAVGRPILGNKAASGTAIIQELGAEHMKSGAPICYTSADSVFQIAAHEEIIPVEELYDMCRTARRLCDPYMVGRVIARPFIGSAEEGFTRTSRRQDFSIALPEPSILTHLQKDGVKTIGVGKIGDIFNEEGLSESHHDKGNPACLDRTLELLKQPTGKRELIFVNLVDTDMIYGHRRDIQGYHDAVAAVDKALEAVMGNLQEGDLLIITADHGCDPGFKGTDHTREYVPLLAYRKGLTENQSAAELNLGIRSSFTDTAAALADYFSAPRYKRGQSFLNS